MEPQSAPDRLRTKASWLLNNLSAQGHRLIGAHLHAAHIAHRYHFSLLAALAESGPTSQADLGRRIGLDRSDVTAALADLESHGYVARSPDPADKRRNLVSVTAGGLRHLEAMDAILGGAQAELLAPLTEGEREELVRMLRVLVEFHQAGGAAHDVPR